MNLLSPLIANHTKQILSGVNIVSFVEAATDRHLIPSTLASTIKTTIFKVNTSSKWKSLNTYSFTWMVIVFFTTHRISDLLSSVVIKAKLKPGELDWMQS